MPLLPSEPFVHPTELLCAEEDPHEHLVEALDAGLRRAAQAISRFGPEGLLAPPAMADGAAS